MRWRHWLPVGIAAVSLAALACDGAEGPQQTPTEAEAAQTDRIPATVVGAEESEVRWLMPESADELGTGIEIRMLVDYTTVPHASVGAFVVTAPSILVHAHVMQAEMIYVIGGEGVALVGDGQEEVPLAPGSALYVPERAWHGFRSSDPDERLKLLIITRPTHEGGLADFFRAAATRPREEPLELSPEDFVRLLEAHGMEVPPAADDQPR